MGVDRSEQRVVAGRVRLDGRLMAARTITVELPSGVLTDSDLSDAAPADLSTAASGMSTEASRADHVHPMPTAADVGALPDDTTLLALGETSSTAYRGDRGKTAYDHSQTGGNPHGTTPADVGAQPADYDLTAIAALTPSNDDFLQRKAGAWTNRTVAQVKSDLGLSAPAAVSHFYEDNTYSGLQGLNHATLAGGGSGQVYGQNLLVLWRIMPVMDVDVDGFLLQVQVDGGSGALARVGIFAQDSTSAPTGAPLLDSGDIGVNVSAGNQVSGTTSTARLSAWTPYWGAFVTNSSSLSIRWMAAGANNNSRVSSIDAGQSSSANHTLRRVAHTFGALPTSPVAAFTTAYSDIPGVLWRVQV